LNELLPVIKILFDKNLVAIGVNGDFQKVKKYFSEPEKFSHKKEIYSIFELYDDVLYSWSGYKDQKEKDIPKENVPQPAKSDKIGRNDPCPCGSGKKYKKCCMKND
jgi:preprotein translocase subunit SecA